MLKRNGNQRLSHVDHNQLYDPLPFRIMNPHYCALLFVCMILNGKGSSN